LTNKGKMVADFVVYAEPDAYLLDLEPQAVHPFITAIEGFVVSEEVLLSDESAQWGLLSLQGPRAAELLALVLGRNVPDLPLYAHTCCQVAGQQLRLIRRSHTGELGYQLLAPLGVLPELWQTLWQHHAACGLRAVGLETLEVLRIEAGLPVYGRDITDETIPIEANLTDAVSYTKGCYIGQEVIARLESRGHVNRKLMGLLLDGDTLPESGAAISSSAREVGWVTSAAYSPACQQNVALGYMRREVWAPGTRLEVQTKGMTMRAVVVDLPFYKPYTGVQQA
jgi:folate-binding protein YgfZ